MEIRKIKKIIKSKPVIEGAGVHLKRAFGFSEVPDLDPFLLLDDFRSDEPYKYLRGFPWHPHRGIETITYVLNGKVEHGDSLGNKGIIGEGDVQWMTAGSGIIHQEMPKGDENNKMFGFQLWANLPSNSKMMKPRYQEIKASQIPETIINNKIKIKVICGNINNTEGHVKGIITDPEYLDITIPANSEYIHKIKKGYKAFSYVIGGKGYFCREKENFNYDIEGINYFDFKRQKYFENETLVIFEDGDEIIAAAEDNDFRFLLISGKPIGEPVAWYGPIVMNTREELKTAFEELDNGNFIKD